MKNNKLSIIDKLLLFIYIVLLVIPFGLSLVVLIYAVLYYIFKVPLKRERELLNYVSNKLEYYIKKIIK
tara:strand:- start:6918 stop:7124 length:207 start_codon:yes stop_codon:yes gene_type:complete